MEAIIKHYIVDLSSNNNFISIPTVQGDGNGVRTVEIELVQNGTSYVLDSDVTGAIMGTKPDTKQICNPIEITEDGYVRFDITSQMAAVKGRGDYQVVFFGKDNNSQLKSFPFIIITTEATFDVDYLESRDEFQLLSELINKAQADYEYVITESGKNADRAESAKDSAVESETNAKVSEENAKESETNAKTSEINAKTSEINAKNSEDNAKVSETNADESERNAKASENNAQVSETNAKESETNSKISETNAKESEVNAKDSENNAFQSEQNAKTSEDSAKASEMYAEEYASHAKTSEDNAKLSEDNARTSEENALSYRNDAEISASNAATSEANAKSSENIVVTSAESAALSEANALEYATSANVSKESALASKNDAESAANSASESASSASESSNSASSSAESASSSKAIASEYADMSKSYSVGTNGEIRPNDQLDNAKYYMEQAKQFAQGLVSAIKPRGTATFEYVMSLPDVNYGDMFDISNNFTTNEKFRHPGVEMSVGTNIYFTVDDLWDCLPGTSVIGIKGESESTYRVGNVNITRADIGSYEVSSTSEPTTQRVGEFWNMEY